MILGKRYSFNERSVLELDDIQQKSIKAFKSKNYSLLTKRNCFICGEGEFETLSEKDRYGFPLTIVICAHCGLVFSNPYYDEASLARFYNEDYRGIYNGYDKKLSRHVLADFFHRKQFNKGRYIYKFIRTHYGEIKNKKVAEVGAGSGGILYYFQKQGNDVVGVDFGEDYLEFGKSEGVNLYSGDITELEKRNIKVDILIYADALEHIPDIHAELSYAKKILNDDGIIFVKLPSIKNLERAYRGDFLRQIQNAHIFYFSLQTLVNLMAKNGFELIYGSEEICAMFKKGNPNRRAVNDYHAIRQYLLERENERKRLKTGREERWRRVKKRLSGFLKKRTLLAFFIGYIKYQNRCRIINKIIKHMTPRILAIIPARGGSKSVPKKNIKPLGGKPLLYYMLNAALKSALLTKVVVSSDSDEILAVAEKYGGKDILLKRPKELAEDTTPDVPMLQHAVWEMEKRDGKQFDYIVQLHVTTPFFTPTDVDNALAILLSHPEADSVVSVYELTDFSPPKIKKIVDGKLAQYFSDTEELSTSRRQDREPAYKRNAGLYASKRTVVMDAGRVFGDVCMPYIMPEEQSVDINNQFDFVIAEATLARLKESNKF